MNSEKRRRILLFNEYNEHASYTKKAMFCLNVKLEHTYGNVLINSLEDHNEKSAAM